MRRLGDLNRSQERRPLRVLFVEDSDDDVLLMARELQLGGYHPDCARVDTAVAMRLALERGPWDIVIADYTMPRFSAPEALAVLAERGLDVPCIVVSGTMDEAIIVATMRYGARDYLLKGNLARLVPAVERELREAADRNLRRHAESALESKEAYLQAVLEHVADGLVTMDDRGVVESCNAAAARIFGLPAHNVVGAPFKKLLGGRGERLAGDRLADVLGVPDPAHAEVQVLGRRQDGRTFPMELVTSSATVAGRRVVIAVVRDVSRRADATRPEAGRA